MGEEKDKREASMPTNIRLTPGVVDEFRKVSSRFSSQNETLEELLKLYENDTLLQKIPQYAKPLGDFRQYLSIIEKKYTDALMDLSMAEVKAQESISRILGEKDRSIVELQGELSKLQSENKTYKAQYVTVSDENKGLQERNDELKDSIKQRDVDAKAQIETHVREIKDKEQINSMLVKTIEQLEISLKEVKDYPERLEELQVSIDKLQENLKTANDVLKDERSQARLDKMEAVQEVEKRMREEIEKIRADARVAERQHMQDSINLRETHSAEIKELYQKFEEKESARKRIQKEKE